MIASAAPLASQALPAAALLPASPTPEMPGAPTALVQPIAPSFDATLAAIGPVGNIAVPATATVPESVVALPTPAPSEPSVNSALSIPATHIAAKAGKDEELKEEAPDTDSVQPDMPSPTVAPMVPAPASALPPAPVPESTEPPAPSLVQSIPVSRPAVANTAQTAPTPEAAHAETPPVASDAKPEVRAATAAPAAQASAMQMDPTTDQASSTPQASAPRQGAAPAAINIDLLFPRGSDRPLTVTFTQAPPPAIAPAADPVIQPVAMPAALPSPPAASAVPPHKSGEGDPLDIGATDATARPLAPLLFSSPPPIAASGSSSPQAPDASAQAVVVQQHLDLARNGAWLDSLARDIARVADKDGRLSFRLDPAHLGTLHVQMANGADGTSIRLTADTEAARAILVDSRHHLVAEARAQGVRIADTQIDVGGAAGQGATQTGGHHQGGGHGHMGGQQQALLTILPQTRTVAEGQAAPAVVRERYA